jgi:CSLREA domain-containing protein
VRAAASIISIVLAACSYEHGRVADSDGGVDAPPVTTKVHFTSLTTTATIVRPGIYGIEVTAVLRNDLDVAITDVAAALDVGGRGDVRQRDADRRDGVLTAHPDSIAAGSEATFHFVIDALPWLAAADLVLDGVATFRANDSPLSASGLPTRRKVAYTGINAPILVTTVQDESNGNAQVSLREAITSANNLAGPDRIVFDPTVFGAGATITLADSLGELPAIAADLVIDGTGMDVTLAVSSAWQDPEGRYGLRIVNGTVAVSGLTFRNFAYAYRDEAITTDGGNCGTSNAQLQGGAIRVDGGTLILDSNRFVDPDVAERNCYAASVRLHGGSNHRIIGNTWTDQVMDSLFIAARTLEITDNVMVAPAHPERADEGVYISSQGGGDLWVIGNVIVDSEYSGVVAGGSDTGKLYVINNTFVRNGRVSLAALRRSGSRAVMLRNNVYIANQPAAFEADNNASGIDAAYESVTGSPLCIGCSGATINLPTIVTPADPGVMNMTGTSRTDFTPATGSPLIDAADPWLDRNGATPRRFSGTGQERGAVELP